MSIATSSDANKKSRFILYITTLFQSTMQHALGIGEYPIIYYRNLATLRGCTRRKLTQTFFFVTIENPLSRIYALLPDRESS